jgi:acetylornithine deacetylase/succinyl-diaminopimelate desuccinylase-like protein
MSVEANCMAYARSRRARFVAELIELVHFASVSAEPKRAGDIRNCAAWLAAQQMVGFDRVEVVPTNGSPIIIAEWLHAGGRPTVLVYGHYHVQLTNPTEFLQWYCDFRALPDGARAYRLDALHGHRDVPFALLALNDEVAM